MEAPYRDFTEFPSTSLSRVRGWRNGKEAQGQGLSSVVVCINMLIVHSLLRRLLIHVSSLTSNSG